MADVKISALPASTTPLGGTETVPLVQSGTTKKVSVDNLTAGRAVPANAIQFPASQSASADPNALDDYEEGTFVPVVVGSATAGVGTYTAQSGRYTKIGNIVHFELVVVWTAHTGTGNVRVNGLPFTPAASIPEAIVPALLGGITFVGSPVGIVSLPSGQVAFATSATGAPVSYTATISASGFISVAGSYTAA